MSAIPDVCPAVLPSRHASRCRWPGSSGVGRRNVAELTFASAPRCERACRHLYEPILAISARSCAAPDWRDRTGASPWPASGQSITPVISARLPAAPEPPHRREPAACRPSAGRRARPASGGQLRELALNAGGPACLSVGDRTSASTRGPALWIPVQPPPQPPRSRG